MVSDRVDGSGRVNSVQAFEINGKADQIAQDAYFRIRDLYGESLPAMLSLAVHSMIADFAGMPHRDKMTLVCLLDEFIAPYREMMNDEAGL